MTLKPLFDKVVIKQEDLTDTTPSGIILTGNAKEKPVMATVVAVGPGGIIDGKLQTFDQQITQQEKSITNFNERMEKKEADYKRQFGSMEAMYERLKDSSRALDSLNSGNNGNK